MRTYRLGALLVTTAMITTLLAGCSTASDRKETTVDSATQVEGSTDDIVSFRPVDCGIQAQDKYDFPFLGMTATLTDQILDKLDSREVFAFTQEDYTASYDISYAVIRFSTTTKEQRAEEGMSVDILSWEATLDKIGAIGIYEKSVVSQLDQLTACDTHEQIGTSSDGAYEYYISTNSAQDSALTSQLKATEVSISEMHDFDPNQGYTAFSADRIDGVATVGRFKTEDVLGNAYTEAVFQDYDLTLVNVFTTWCSPCVKEMPELEELRQYYEKKGIKLGVVAVVLDAKYQNSIDEGAMERAQALYKKSKAQFPFLIPDDGNMNGRLVGIESVPESFFVDSNGNIVSEPYVGARSMKEWQKIVDAEFKNLEGVQ